MPSPELPFHLQLKLDPWQADYGPEFTGFDDATPDSAEDADLEIEHPLPSWRPIPPASQPIFPTTYFIDGVRRVEAQIIAAVNGFYTHGVFGAFAVGAAQLSADTAGFEGIVCTRILALHSPVQPSRPLTVANELTYTPLTVDDPGPDAPKLAIHNEMRKYEEGLARFFALRGDSLVVCDGPLSFEQPARGAAVGYIKRIMRTYLPPPQLQMLTRLPPAHRTPLFALKSSRRFARYSWFLRLADPYPGDSDFSGIVRLEVSANVGVPEAIRLADACGHTLPNLRARRGLDQRAPQNLLPIGALENRLRRAMGDERVVRRRIETFLAAQSSLGVAS